MYFNIEAKLPIILNKYQKIGVVCIKEPIHIKQSCEQGYKPCNNSECILEIYFCDQKPHCTDESDEVHCENYCSDPQYKDLYFQCLDGSCISVSRLCNLIPDCELGEDEEECPDPLSYNKLWSPLRVKKQEQMCIRTDSNALNSMLYQQCNVTCAEKMYPSEYFNYTSIDYAKYVCPFGSPICYPKAYDCVHDKDFYGNVVPCEEAWQFLNCQNLDKCENLFCKDKYLCHNQKWCIPYRLVCNGVIECPMGDDEENCTNFVCHRMLRCT